MLLLGSSYPDLSRPTICRLSDNHSLIRLLVRFYQFLQTANQEQINHKGTVVTDAEAVDVVVVVVFVAVVVAVVVVCCYSSSSSTICGLSDNDSLIRLLVRFYQTANQEQINHKDTVVTDAEAVVDVDVVVVVFVAVVVAVVVVCCYSSSSTDLLLLLLLLRLELP